jgi:hypothetical protein
MSEIVNLRRARKQKARTEAEKEAETKRAAFGRSKDEKQGAAAEARRAEKHLDAHKRDSDV